MKKNLTKIFTTLTVAAILAVGVSYVSAQSGNSQSTQPIPVVNAPIHTGIVTQSKMGDILSEKLLVAPIGLFKKAIFLPGKNASLRIGSSDTATGTQVFSAGTSGVSANHLNTMIFNNIHTEPVVLDLVERNNSPAIRYINTGAQCTIATRLVNDRSSAFQFNKGSSSANIIARQIQLTASGPNANDVLVGDAAGNARWAKATVENGIVKFTTGTSPVTTGLQCDTNPPLTCPTGTTGTYPNCITPPQVCNDSNATNYNEAGVCIYSQDICEGVIEHITYNNGETARNYTPDAKLYYKASAPVQSRCKIVVNGSTAPVGYVLASESQSLDDGVCTWFDKTPYTDPTAGDLHTYSSTNDCSANTGQGPKIKFSNLWYCHINGGTWKNVTTTYASEGFCQHTENYRQGYYNQSYVCSKTQPTASSCLTATQYNSGLYTPLMEGCTTPQSCFPQ